MSDMIELTEPTDSGTSMRDENPRDLGPPPRRRQLRSRIMVTLSAIALATTAVPLLLLLYQLFSAAYPLSCTPPSTPSCPRRRR